MHYLRSHILYRYTMGTVANYRSVTINTGGPKHRTRTRVELVEEVYYRGLRGLKMEMEKLCPGECREERGNGG